MEASALRDSQPGSNAGLFKDARTGFLRLQSDERLVSLTRRGNEAAFEVLIGRYRARLLAFCRHMVGSTEDAEDILQEVFVSAYRAMLADDRELNVRPWLYRIARNRSLNHLRRPRPTGVDSMDVYEGGASVQTADRVQDKLDLADLVEDVKKLPETQRTALMLREMGQLSYDQIAEAMDTSIPSVKSLLVRARVSLAEAAEARRLTCDEVRLELGAVAEGLKKMTPSVRKHVADCDRCRAFKKDVALTNRKLAVLAPVGGLLLVKNVLALKLFGGTLLGGSSAAGGSAGIGVATGAGSGAGGGIAAGAAATAGGAAVTGGVSAGLGAVVTKAAAGVAAAGLITAGATQVAKHDVRANEIAQQPAVTAPAEPKPAVPAEPDTGGVKPVTDETDEREPVAEEPLAEPTAPVVAPEPAPVEAPAPAPRATAPEEEAEIIDEETTPVVVDPVSGPKSEPTGPSSGTEGPGLPTAPPPAGPTPEPAPAPAPAPTSPPPATTSATGAVSSTGTTGATN